ncbi:MAG TPA: CusA/CzcA family heavy metal efflux RND transporter [Myxococcales bacterium]|nr:CusA/CzcA family heavy metal efflux RND transporter [Myxococcales bacterium]
MIGRIIAACASNRLATLLVVALVTAWGVISLRSTALDAIPDLSDVQVIVYSEWMGRAPDLVEDNITYPVVSSMLGSPRVTAVRGQSMFGMSFVNVIFEDGTDLYWARSRVLEKLSSISNKLPQGVTPVLGPDATAVGWVFEYALVDRTGRTTLQQLQSLQDWNLRYALQAVPGVAEVASIGGFVKEYQVNLDPDRLAALNIPLGTVVNSVRMSNADVGGRVLEVSGTEHYVRGRGYVKTIKDLERVVLGSQMGTPVLLRDVAAIGIGPAQRRGLADLDGEGETVGGVVIARAGTNALAVIDAVKARIAEIAPTLPPGTQIVPTYDRSRLIRESIETLRRTLIEELIAVAAVILVFLLHLRSTLIPALLLPIAVVAAFIPMKQMGLTANIMSLGGIAIAIGAMVDAAIIVVENVHKRLERWEREGRKEPRAEVVLGGLQEVGRPIFFSLLVITVGFLPVFTLEGTEGRLFSPLAWTKTFSMAAAALLSITLVPAIAATFIRGRIRDEEHNPVSRLLTRLYDPVCRLALRFRWAVIAGAVVLMAATIPIVRRLGSEFMPPLNEGTLLYMPSSVPGMSDAAARDVLQRMDQVLRRFPEVARVFGKAGRFDTATDPAPLSMFETVVELKPPSEWPAGEDWDGLVRKLDGAMQFAGMPNVWWMPIQTRTEMLATGVRSPLGVLVLGPDTAVIDRIGAQIEAALREVPGTRSAFAERIGGGYFLDFDVNRDHAARFGLNVGDVEDAVETAIGGLTVSTTIEGRERYPVTVRYARDFRSDLQALRRVRVATMDGAHIALGQVASLELRTGPAMLRDENGQLAGYVFADTARPIEDYVRDAKAAVARRVKLPPGYRLEWAGQYRYLERAKARLAVVVPVTLFLIFLLLFFNSRSPVEALIVMLAVPFSLVGAFWLLWLLGYNLSVAVWVGIIALAGLDAETGIVMLLYLDLAWKERKPQSREEAREAVVHGAVKRIRPKIMTVATILVGLVPILWSAGTGADVMKRIAAPMVGGVVTSALLELLVYPALYLLWKGRYLRA